MSTALQVFQMIFYTVAIIFMIAFMIIGIWSFVLFNKTCKTQVIKNYLLDKLNKNIMKLNSNSKDQSNPIDFLSDLGLNENNDLNEDNNL